MKKQLLYRAAAATVLGLSLTTGVASADHSYQNYDHNKGHNGNNSLAVDLSANVSNVGVTNETHQNAFSGPAVVTGSSNKDEHHHGDYNKHDDNNGGSSSNNKAVGGNATNDNSTKGKVVVDQSSAAPAAGSNSQSSDNDHGKGGNNSVDLSASLNYSNVEVNNETDQNAVSGPAVVTGNNKGGSAFSGNASNSNSTDFTVVVKQ